MKDFVTTPLPAPDRARHFATLRHGTQEYNDEVPYPVHLESVVRVCSAYGFDDPVTLCCAWLHDVMEDTNTNYNAILERFGKDVAEGVYAVTSELGRNRAERNERTYPKIRGNHLATVVKLADRIANVEYGYTTGSKMTAKYKQEYPGFKKAIRVVESEHPQVTRMWEHLDRLLA